MRRGFAALGSLTALVLLLGIGSGGDESRSPDDEVARQLGITPQQVRLLNVQRGLSNKNLLEIPRPKLERALWRLAHPMPDNPGEAAKFNRLRSQVDAKGKVPPDALPAAIARVKQMRQEVAKLPATAKMVMNKAAIANPALGTPYRVAGMPVGPLRQHPGAASKVAAAAPVLSLAGIIPGGWTWLGPGNIGGRTRSIVIHPTTPTIMWAGAVGGGVWKTIDGGASWAPLNDFMASLNVSCLAVDPTNSDTVYAGTGEGFYNIDGYQGAGIFTSTDGGTTWNQLASTTGPEFKYVNRLAIASDASVILAAARSPDASVQGIWRSTDKGATFTAVASIAGNEILDVKLHPSDATKCVAGGRNGKAFFSTDGGQNWTAAMGLPTPAAFAGRVELSYATNNPDTVYASVDNNSGEVYLSSDGGQNYTLQNTGTNYLGNQGWYANTIWAGDPTDANLVVVGGLDLYRSTDAGVTFTQVSTWWKMPASPHADHHTITTHPAFDGAANKIVFFGNDGGIYQSTDIRASVDTTGWQVLNNNYGVTQFYGAAGNVSTGKIVGGAQDNGTLRYTPPPGANTGPQGYTSMFGGDGGFCAADPTNPNFFYGEYVFLQIHRSIDGGTSSNSIYTGITDAGDQNKSNFIAPFILDPNDPNTMYAGGSRLWKSNNVTAATPAWTDIKPDIGSPISAIAVAQGNSQILWVGHNSGAVYNSVDGGANWTQVGTGSPSLPGRYCSRITIDASNTNVVYVTFGGYITDNVWKTTDGGTSFADLGASLPPAPVYSLAIHPDNPAFLYLGTEVGVFASADGGATWSPTNEGPTNCSVNELSWLNRVLVAVTHGRGLFTIDLTTPGPVAHGTAPVPGPATKKAARSIRKFEVATDPSNAH